MPFPSLNKNGGLQFVTIVSVGSSKQTIKQPTKYSCHPSVAKEALIKWERFAARQPTNHPPQGFLC